MSYFPASHPDFSLSWIPIEVTLGAIYVGLTVVALQPVLLGGLKNKQENVQPTLFKLSGSAQVK